MKTKPGVRSSDLRTSNSAQGAKPLPLPLKEGSDWKRRFAKTCLMHSSSLRCATVKYFAHGASGQASFQAGKFWQEG